MISRQRRRFRLISRQSRTAKMSMIGGVTVLISGVTALREELNGHCGNKSGDKQEAVRDRFVGLCLSLFDYGVMDDVQNAYMEAP